MRIRYETSLDDMVVFQKDHQKNAPEMKRLKLRLPVLAAGYAVLMLALGFCTGEWLALVLPFAIGVPLYILFLATLVKVMTKYVIKQQYQGEKARGILGEHTLEVAEDGLIERTEYNETKTAWAMIGRIETTATHTFIYTGPQKAYVIPHQMVTEGSLPAFLKTLGEQYKPDGKLQMPSSFSELPRKNLEGS